MSKIISVFGATGNQGGSVINAILGDANLTKEYKLRGITRDASRPSAKALADRGVEVVVADMDSVETAGPAVAGAHTVFIVTNFWEHMSPEKEVAQGRAVVDAAKAAGVKRIVFSSLIDVTKASEGRLKHVLHFDSKCRVEEYIRESGISAVFFLPGLFMNTVMDLLMRKGDDGVYTLALPVDGDKAKAPLFEAIGDSGKYVKMAIEHWDDFAGKRLYAAEDYYSPNRIVAEFKEATGKDAKFVQLPVDVFKSNFPAASAQELTENMLLLENPGYYAGAKLTHENMKGKLSTWKDYTKANKDKW